MVAPFQVDNGHLQEMPESIEHTDAASNGSAISASNHDSVGAASKQTVKVRQSTDLHLESIIDSLFNSRGGQASQRCALPRL